MCIRDSSCEFCLRTTPLTFSFYELPSRYDEVMSELFTKNCANCNLNILNKCICLVCGTIVCVQSDCCLKEAVANNENETIGELSYHTINCCYFAGIYLYMHHGTLVLQSEGMGVEVDSCYTNSFGENVSASLTDPEAQFYSRDLAEYTLNADLYAHFKSLMLEGNVIGEIRKREAEDVEVFGNEL
eukprot:TRINITY_DN16095_c0_g1_i10.p1 TRINITY_DN16095_c0_g1~~TRINITY_DN16095_c0_g1_i10.p1  ORF type:complete len:186 (+),score=41.11 TRINITY_DN16095_c0_g1_i10:73-630(+)